jgi:hypothetical protein
MLQQRHLRRVPFNLGDDPLHKCVCDTRGLFCSSSAISQYNTTKARRDGILNYTLGSRSVTRGVEPAALSHPGRQPQKEEALK